MSAFPDGGAWEANLTPDRSTAAGEPSVAVNPLDPDNVLVTYLVTGGPVTDVFDGRIPDLASGRSVATHCRYAVSHDGGRSWRHRDLPITDVIMANCADSYVLFDTSGKAYVMAGAFNIAFPVWDEIRVITSVDGGETWATPVTALRNTLGPSSAPAEDLQSSRLRQYIDRYWMAIDDSDGAIYITAVQTWLQSDGTSGPVGPIVASQDGGATWSEPVLAAPVGSPHVGAARGTVAVAHNGSACGCVTLALSDDGARTFRFVETPVEAGGRPQVVADQTTPGRFAVMVPYPDQIEVAVTSDHGATWSEPAGITPDPPLGRFKPWISYSRSGVLGAGWRTRYSDSTYDFWAAVSNDGGTTWEPARAVSTAASPPEELPHMGLADDTSDVQFGPDDTLYASWGDWRSGDRDVWWGGFPTR